MRAPLAVVGLLLAAAGALPACAGDGSSDSESSEDDVRGATGTSPIRSLDPTGDDRDLAAFDAVVGTTALVGLGETIHTSGGYHRIRTRLARHMIEKLGFRAVALETPWRTAEIATRYVERCEGSSSQAAASIFPVFASVQMTSLFEWMCRWNTTHPGDRVSFYGYDAQDPWADGVLFAEFVRRASPADAAIASGLDACLGVKHRTAAAYFADPAMMAIEYGQVLLGDAEFTACEAAVKVANDWLVANGGALAARTSAADVRWATLAVDGIDAYEKKTYWLHRGDNPLGFEARDQAMARALLGIRELRSPGKRVVVIAHNTHLAHAQSKVGGQFGGTRAMGQMLKEDHHADYEAIGFLASVVHINWSGFPDPEVPTGPGSAEVVLHALGRPALFVDLERTNVLTRGKSYGIALENMVPREQFRALVYLNESEAMEYSR